MTEFLTTRELADLLRIKERKVYDLAASGEVPCNKAMGKLLFPRREIEAWLDANASGPAFAPADDRPAVVLGSHDPLLDWAIRESRSGLATRFDSSLDGLERFGAGDGIAAGLHIPGNAAGEWNVEAVRERCGTQRVVLVHWAVRQRGLCVTPGLEDRIGGLADLAGRRFIPRQPEAGSQILFGSLAEDAGLDPDTVEFADPARSEADAALGVSEGKADATFGLAAIAAQYRLGFVPVVDEEFDLLVDRHAWFQAPFQTFLGFCGTRRFANRASELAGYDVQKRFEVRFNGGA